MVSRRASKRPTDGADPSSSRLLVCIGPSPGSAHLVRAAHRMAAQADVPWVAATVDAPGRAPVRARDRARLDAHLELARSLGGGVERLSGVFASEVILDYARRHGVTRIVLGKPTHSRLRDVVGGSLLEGIVRGSGELEVHVLAGEGEDDTPQPATPASGASLRLRPYLGVAVVVGVVTALASFGHDVVGVPDVEMLYLLGIVVAATRVGRAPSIFAAALSVASFDFFFVPPRFTFDIEQTNYALTFAMMLGIGVLLSSLTLRLRRQQDDALRREARTVVLSREREQLAEEARRASLRAKAEELRSALLSTVSHDLRTPLAAITGAGTTLRDEASLPASTRAELLDTICEEAERLERLVRNLLDMTRLDAGAVELRRDWLPVVEVIGTATTRLEARLEGRVLKVDLPEGLPLVHLDPILAEQLFTNLLENAAKHTPAGTPIEIAARVEADGVVVEVADRGAGFPEGDADRLFERFYRLAGSRVPGAGLGLAIARAIAVAHGGTLTATNRPGGGALFRLTLPEDGAPPDGPPTELEA